MSCSEAKKDQGKLWNSLKKQDKLVISLARLVDKLLPLRRPELVLYTVRMLAQVTKRLLKVHQWIFCSLAKESLTLLEAVLETHSLVTLTQPRPKSFLALST